MNHAAVLFEIDGGIATVTLNDGDRMNPLGDDVIDGLIDAIGQVREDRQVRALILTGRGRGFCVGADLALFQWLNRRFRYKRRSAKQTARLQAG